MRLALLVCSTFVLVLSILGFQKEYAPAITLQATGRDAAQFLTTLDVEAPPSSARILRDLITLCTDSVRLSDVYGLSPDDKENLFKSCADLASHTLEKSPAFARAHILALTSQPLESVTAEAYHLARMSAPHEPWPLSNRLLLAERLAAEELHIAFETEIRADVETAMLTNWGRTFLAGIWTRQPTLRDLIIAIAETRPAADQRHFLNQTRRAFTNG